jgi:hypothetical protein
MIQWADERRAQVAGCTDNHMAVSTATLALFSQKATQEFIDWLGDSSEDESESESEGSAED